MFQLSGFHCIRISPKTLFYFARPLNPKLRLLLEAPHIGALIIATGFWGPLYYNYNKEPPKKLLVIIKAPILY